MERNLITNEQISWKIIDNIKLYNSSLNNSLDVFFMLKLGYLNIQKIAKKIISLGRRYYIRRPDRLDF